MRSVVGATAKGIGYVVVVSDQPLGQPLGHVLDGEDDAWCVRVALVDEIAE